MGNDQNLVWLGLCAAGGVLLFLLLRWLRRKPSAPPGEAPEQSPVPVEGSLAFTGRHKGVKYWIYYENNQARLEIETGGEITAPFLADRREGKPKLPGDARDAEVQELLRLGALYVEAAANGNLIAAHFEERYLNANAGTRHAPRPEEDNANKAAELLTALRDKSGAPA
jgi:hypothetical protein